MITSGTTPLATTGAGIVDVPNISSPGMYDEITVITTGSAPGFIALDGGANDSSWAYIPAGANGGSLTLRGPLLCSGSVGLCIKRAGGVDMSGVYVAAQPG